MQVGKESKGETRVEKKARKEKEKDDGCKGRNKMLESEKGRGTGMIV